MFFRSKSFFSHLRQSWNCLHCTFCVCIKKRNKNERCPHSVNFEFLGAHLSWLVQLWGVNNSWEGGCPLQFLRELQCACGATCWIWDFPPLALGHISLWGDEEDSCVGSCERKIMGFLVQSVIKSHLFLCIEVLVALGILYQSAALVAVTAGGDKDCQNEILLPLERPFTGQHS